MVPPKKTVKPPKKKKAASDFSLIEGLKLLGHVAKDTGQGAFAVLGNGRATVFDGIIAVSAPIPTNGDATLRFPHALTMLRALEHMTATFTLSPYDNRIVLEDGPLQVVVPCAVEHFPIRPDPPSVDIDARLLHALMAVATVARENATQLLESSILLLSGSALATNRHVLIEAWHGHDLPGMTLPKSTVTMLARMPAPITQIGFGWIDNQLRSATFYCGRDVWLRSQLYVESWPLGQIAKIWGSMPDPDLIELPDEFWPAIETFAHLRAKTVTLGGDYLQSEPASFKLAEPFPVPRSVYAVDHLYPLMELGLDRADLRPDHGYFAGDNIRAMVSGISDAL